MSASQTPLRSQIGPACEACGAIMMLKDFQPHPTLARHELRTYRCPACSREEVLGAPTLGK
jgi:hypothetical protein